MIIIPTELESFSGRANELIESAARIAKIAEQNGMKKKVAEIRKRIELSRSLASSVKMGVVFEKKNTVPPEFSQPRIPPQISSVEDALNIELYVNVSYEPNNSILYFGDVSVSFSV